MTKNLAKLSSFLPTVCALAIGLSGVITGSLAHAQNWGLSPPDEAKANPALANAKRRLSTLESELKEAERNLFFLNPPVRTTDGKGVTTVDPIEQRRYEQNSQMWSKKVQNLRQEQLVWQLQANQLLAMETAQKNALQATMPVAAPAPPPTIIYVPMPMPMPMPAPSPAQAPVPAPPVN